MKKKKSYKKPRNFTFVGIILGLIITTTLVILIIILVNKKSELYSNKIKYNNLHKKKEKSNIFSKIFKQNLWGSNESISGYGSTIKNTKNIREKLPLLIKKYKINTVFDVPCGDFNWMKLIVDKIPNYIGGDIVGELVENNKKKFKQKFIITDLRYDKIIPCDLLFVRDCLFHLSYSDIWKIINNIKKSNTKYILTTNFLNRQNNDIKMGDWRPLCLQEPPFNFPKPIEIIKEDEKSFFADKHMGLWLIKSLPNGELHT